MEFQLTVSGTADEIRQVLDALSVGTDRVGMTTPALGETVQRFIQGLSDDGTAALLVMVRGALGDLELPDGATEEKIEEILGKNPYGVIGGLARRWAAMQGPTFDSPPFRKRGGGKSGCYVLPEDLAAELKRRLPLR